MRLSDKIAIARQNIVAGKTLVWKMVFGMMFIVMLMLSFSVLYKSFDDYIKSFGESNVRECYYLKVYYGAEFPVSGSDEMIKDAIATGKEKRSSETSILYTIDYVDSELDLETSKIHLQIDEQEYKHKSKYVSNSKFYEDMFDKNSLIEMALYRDGMNVFPQNIQKRFGRECIIGRLPDNPGEIMLDTHMLQVYGVSVNEDLLGSTFSMVYFGDDGEKILIEEYVLTGIVKSEIFAAREGADVPDYHWEHMYINLKPEDEHNYYILYGSERYYQENYLAYINNCDYVDELLSLDMDVLGDENVEVKLTPKGMEYCLLYWLMNDIGRLLLIVGVVVAVIITFSLFYIFRFYISRNEKYFSMLENIGMKRKDRRMIFIMEVAMIILIATLMGAYLSAMFLLLINLLLKSMLNFSLTFNLQLCMGMILVSWIYFALCIVAVHNVQRKRI